MPLFSIVIPCRDAADALPATLASLRAQTFRDWEAICVHHGSSDDTGRVIDRVARLDTRIRRIDIETPGVAAARNIGALDRARGEIVLFLDAGDLWDAGRLEALAARFAQDDRPDMVIGAAAHFRDDPADHSAPWAPESLPTIAAVLAAPSALALSNIALRMATFRAAGGFDARIAAAEQIEWLVRVIAARPRIGVAREAVALLRRRPTLGPCRMRDALRGWAEAVETARILGVAPPAPGLAWAEAAFRRILAERALRECLEETPCPLGRGARIAAALRLAALGILRSPGGFLTGGGGRRGPADSGAAHLHAAAAPRIRAAR